MNTETITFSVKVPEAAAVPRVIEVECGDSRVTVRQVMGRTDRDWTVYEGDGFDQGRNKGLVGQVTNAPRAESPDDLIPWAADLVTRRERARLALFALQKVADDKPHPIPDHDGQPATDQG
jgi:hypothetical protein